MSICDHGYAGGCCDICARTETANSNPSTGLVEDEATLDVFLAAYAGYSDGEVIASVIDPKDDLLTLGALRRILTTLRRAPMGVDVRLAIGEDGSNEAVARAICYVDGRAGDPWAVEQQRVDRDWRDYLPAAAAAIAALTRSGVGQDADFYAGRYAERCGQLAIAQGALSPGTSESKLRDARELAKRAENILSRAGQYRTLLLNTLGSDREAVLAAESTWDQAWATMHAARSFLTSLGEGHE